jgi:hypothetical protein
MGDLLEASKALLKLDEVGALVPHGIGDHGRKCLSWCVGEIEKLRDLFNTEVLANAENEMSRTDHKRLVRELDVALNGEDGAAKQAALCDIVAQVKDQRWKLVRVDQ